MPIRYVLAAVFAAVLCAACTNEAPDPATTSSRSNASILEVPGDASTINGALAKARTGDLVLVAPGVYKEAVRITTPGVTLRGMDREKVIIDGEILRANAVVVTAANVRVQNLTVRNALQNGVLITGLTDASGTGLAARSPPRPGQVPTAPGLSCRPRHRK